MFGAISFFELCLVQERVGFTRETYYLDVFALLLLLLKRDRVDMMSENCGRFEGQLFQHLSISDRRSCGQESGMSGLSPHAAIPTAACTGE